MKIDVITLFPKMFESPFNESMIKRAIDKQIVEINYHDMRQWAWNDYGAVDDRPYGGGVGMLIRVDVIDRGIKEITNNAKPNPPSETEGPPSLDRDGKPTELVSPDPLGKLGRKTRIILTSARGKKYTQQDAQRLSNYENLIIICGHYEGFDERISSLVDEEISIGDYVLTGGELPAMVMMDSVVRLLPGVLGKDQSSKEESHTTSGYIEYPQYTRPEVYQNMKVPEVLLGGDPKKIANWQKEQLRLTK